MATPGFRALRLGFPCARLVLQVHAGLEPLVAGSPWFDEVIPLGSHRQGRAALLREGRSLRGRRFDLGLCLPDSLSSVLLMRVAGVRHVVGYRRGLRTALLHTAVTPPRSRDGRLLMARERHVLGLVEAVGCDPRGTHLELFVTEQEETSANAALATAGIEKGRPLALLAPGASFGPSKLWPAQSFARVGETLAEAGASVAVIGTPAEGRLADRVVASMHRAAVSLAGRLSLGSLKSVVRRARVLIGNDAGARHMAVAFGVSCVVLLGPTSLEKTNLNLERVRVLATDVGCRPCYHRLCPTDHRCMTRIEPERVIEAALPALEGAARGRRTVEARA
jgi:heptosyltransferase-2